MESLHAPLSQVSDLVRGPLMLVLLLGTGCT